MLTIFFFLIFCKSSVVSAWESIMMSLFDLTNSKNASVNFVHAQNVSTNKNKTSYDQRVVYIMAVDKHCY